MTKPGSGSFRWPRARLETHGSAETLLYVPLRQRGLQLVLMRLSAGHSSSLIRLDVTQEWQTPVELERITYAPDLVIT